MGVSARAAALAPHDPPPTLLRVADPVTVAAAPRTVRLITVPVPAEFRGQSAVAYSVRRSRPGAVDAAVDDHGGVVTPDDAHILLTVAVPSTARAGALRLADVHFTQTLATGAQRAIIVPVVVDVAPVRALEASVPIGTVHAVAGGRVDVPIDLRNLGNALDTLRLQLELPEGWRGSLPDGTLVELAPGEQRHQRLALQAPRDWRPGTAFVVVTGERPVGDGRAPAPRTESTREAAVRLVVPVALLTATRGSAAFGPQLGITYSALQAPGLGMTDAWGFTLAGPLTSSVQVAASWTHRPLAGAPGLARVGGGQLFPTLALSHARWRLDAGHAATDFGELGGLVRGGRGVGGLLGDSMRRVQALFATPFLFDGATRDAGVLAGVRVDAVARGAMWSGSVSHLRDPLLTRGALDAVRLGVGSARPSAFGARPVIDARAEMAWRRWADGQGLGASAELARRTSAGEWRLRATSAPGGSVALARGRHDVTLSGGQQLGASRVGVVGWYADDAATLRGSSPGVSAARPDGAAVARTVTQRSAGLGLMPQRTLGTRGTIGLDLRATSAASGDGQLVQQSTTRTLGGFTALRLGTLTATSSALLTRLDRTVALDGRRGVPAEEQQLQWTMQLFVPTRLGAVDLYSALQDRRGPDALAGGQHDVTLRLDQVRLPGLGGRVAASGAIGRITSLGSGVHVVTQRVGLSALLPLATAVRLDLERNPWLRAGGRTGWTTALRVERSFGTPALLRGSRGLGTVFEDRNGNGVRDPGEPGLAGVVVRVGSEVVVTDRAGVYRLTRSGGGVPEVDERSLPFGLLVAPFGARGVRSDAGDGSLDIPVQVTGGVEVRLDVQGDSLAGTRGREALADVAVRAVDALGRRHVARVLAPGVARFDALPAGTYQLEVDATAASEPLVVQGGTPVFTVVGAGTPQVVTVIVGPRRVRLLRGQPVTHRAGATR
jgi:hypothetical protein